MSHPPTTERHPAFARRSRGSRLGRARAAEGVRLRGSRPSRAVAADAGFSLVEMMVATLMMLIVTGAVFALVNPDTETSQAQPEAMDMQQRARVANDVIGKDLLMAGAGVYSGPEMGRLLSFFAPIIPRKMGLNGADAWDTARDDAITITYIPETYSQTTISNAMPQVSAEIKVTDQPNCPKGRELCGFSIGEEALIFDHDGHFDLFTITQVQDDAAHLQHRDQDFSYPYQPGAYVVVATTATYYLDSVNHQLRYYDGYQTDVPVVDNVVGLTFTYFGEPTPPTEPKPTDGSANCLYDATGTYVADMPTLTTNGGSLAPLPISMLHDGPWCGSGSSRFDADLLRVRKVRVTVRVQASQAQFRGTGDQFSIAGTNVPAEKWLPDYTLSFDIAPRNMNLGR